MTSRAEWMPEVDVPSSIPFLSGVVAKALCGHSRSITVHQVAAEVSRQSGVPAKEILGKSRSKGVVRARHALWLALRNMGWSLPEIGNACGVDHTSVLHGVRKASLFLSHSTEPMAGAVASLSSNSDSGEL